MTRSLEPRFRMAPARRLHATRVMHVMHVMHVMRVTTGLCLVGLAQVNAHAQAPTQTPPALVEDVPFITSPDNVTVEMLRIADVGAKDHVIDLGSGDGRIIITAARRFGASGLGVEIVPDLVEKSRESARKAGVAERAEFETRDIFDTDLSRATVVTMYLLPEVNMQLRPRLLRLAPGTRVVSHDWDMGDWAPDRTVKVDVPDKRVGREKFSRIHLWRVPAQVDGLWCAGPRELRFTQNFQDYRVRQSGPGGAWQRWRGRIVGADLPAPAVGQPALAWQDGVLVVRSGNARLPSGTRFEKAAGDKCRA